MKKIIYALCSALVFTGCYADKGNYDYTLDSMNAIEEISFNPEAAVLNPGENEEYIFEFPRPLAAGISTQRIEAQPKQTLATTQDALEYTWIRSYVKDKKAVKDTLYTVGYVDVDLEGNKDMSYDIKLSIYDKSTTLAYYYTIRVKTRQFYQNSWFVLHGNDAVSRKLGNVEVVSGVPAIVPDAFGKVAPEEVSPFTKATRLDFFVGWKSTYLWVAGTPGGSNLYNPYGLNLRYNSDIVNPAGDPVSISYVDHSGGESNNGVTSTITADGRLLLGLPGRDWLQLFYPGEYSTSPDHIAKEDYQLAMVTKNDDKLVMWDKKGNRFLCVTANESFPGISYDTAPEIIRSLLTSKNPILDTHIDYSPLVGELALAGKEPLYMHEIRGNKEDGGAVAYFRDPTTSAVYRYVLTANGGGKGKSAKGDDKPSSGDPLYVIKGSKMTNMTGVTATSPIIHWPMLSEETIYYADKNKVYRYNTGNGQKSIVYAGTTDSTVAVIRFRSTAEGMVNMFKDLIYYMGIGLNKGTQGAVAEIKLTNGGDKDAEYREKLYEGFDTIIDMQFAHIFSYL